MNKKSLALTVFVLTICLSLYTPAWADEPESAAVKGIRSAHSTILDASAYPDGSEYENTSVKIENVRIGLDFGESSVQSVILKNSSERGFSIGSYDDRSFTELFKTLENAIIITRSIDNAESLCAISADSGEVFYTAPPKASLAILALSDSGKAVCEYGENRYFGGFDIIPDESGGLTVINCVELEDYIKGVIPYEMSASWPAEALKAQAVCARTYAVFNLGRYASYGFDMTDDIYCQVYEGIGYANAATNSAVDATAGQLVRWHGQVCDIYYFSSDGGATEDGINVFADMPYLAGKIDPFEKAEDFSFSDWEVRLTSEELTAVLQKKGLDLGSVTNIEPQYSDTGNVIAIGYYDENGVCSRIDGRKCYTGLGLYNCRFTVEKSENEFSFTGSGWGHNCGMSQWGAKAMAGVYGYGYKDIISFYFTGAYVA